MATTEDRSAELEEKVRSLRAEVQRLQSSLLEAGPADLTLAGKTAPSIYLTENVQKLAARVFYLPALVLADGKGWPYVLAFSRPDLVAAFRAICLNPRRMTATQHREYDQLRRWLTDPALFRLLAMPGEDHDLIRSDWLVNVDDLAVSLSIPEVWLRSVEAPYEGRPRDR